VNRRAAAACAATWLTAVTLVAAGGGAGRYAEGAPAGFSGGFGEQSCHACHFHGELNSGPGRVTIAGVPPRLVSGERYELTVTLTRPGLTLGGFQLTARFKDGGAQAGTLVPGSGDEERIGIDVQGGIQYAGHRREGAAPVAPDTSRWALSWTAPATSGSVVFHVSANAADGDERVDGDYIHTAAVETTVGAATPVPYHPGISYGIAPQYP
jgi:hypothetical protein